ncbi:hypothetical protein RRG08_046750 [Elysia crispata]|uniref:Uncharacterized protein n=1 Tax=Elysia crispata TaxID=231223 RepID=A0AAE1DNN3_9GAST|nr:hypothetical protein RRG08_046750 [Elysia crispata]
MCEHTPSPRHPGKPALPSDAVTESAHVSHSSSMKPLEPTKKFTPTDSVSGKVSSNFVDTKDSRLAPDGARWLLLAVARLVLEEQAASRVIFSQSLAFCRVYSS